MTDEQNTEFETWWEKYGQYCRSGGGEYEKSFSYATWEHLTEQARSTIAAPAQESGRWVRCSPSLINAGIDCANTPRREGDGTYSHDHFISHVAPAQEPALEAIAKVRAMYPVDIFPEDGDSLDCKSARMARLTCDSIKRELLAAEDDDTTPPSTAAPVVPEDRNAVLEEAAKVAESMAVVWSLGKVPENRAFASTIARNIRALAATPKPTT